MAKKREIAVSDDVELSEPVNTPETLNSTSSVANTPALQNLLDSGIIEIVDGAIIWRDGHLEHVRREWAANPLQAERDYSDDLDVIRQYGIEL